MARITIEDCEKVVENRFELVVLAVQRARQIFAGDKVTIEEKKEEKPPVIALREIADKSVSTEKLREKVVDGFRTVMEIEKEEEVVELDVDDSYNPYVDGEEKTVN
jgi:DNA-directed RNA polymerase subunit omega